MTVQKVNRHKRGSIRVAARHGVPFMLFLLPSLAVNKNVDFIVVPLYQPLHRLTGTSALNVLYPFVLLLHGLTTCSCLYIRITE